jgi:hypothetical protein
VDLPERKGKREFRFNLHSKPYPDAIPVSLAAESASEKERWISMMVTKDAAVLMSRYGVATVDAATWMEEREEALMERHEVATIDAALMAQFGVESIEEALMARYGLSSLEEATRIKDLMWIHGVRTPDEAERREASTAARQCKFQQIKQAIYFPNTPPSAGRFDRAGVLFLRGTDNGKKEYTNPHANGRVRAEMSSRNDECKRAGPGWFTHCAQGSSGFHGMPDNTTKNAKGSWMSVNLSIWVRVGHSCLTTMRSDTADPVTSGARGTPAVKLGSCATGYYKGPIAVATGRH